MLDYVSPRFLVLISIPIEILCKGVLFKTLMRNKLTSLPPPVKEIPKLINLYNKRKFLNTPVSGQFKQSNGERVGKNSNLFFAVIINFYI